MDYHLDLQYFPSITSFKKLYKGSNVVFDTYVPYEKRKFLNRCAIGGANGPILLSVPLVGGRNQNKPFRDVRILNEGKWQTRHWRSILSTYNGSPWFFHFTDGMAGLYEKRFDYLLDWNLACLAWLYDRLKTTANYRISSEPLYSNTLKMEVDDELITYEPVRYLQVFEDKTGFIPDLSIIDLLFCTGPVTTVDLLRDTR